jgi:hypothetical protein
MDTPICVRINRIEGFVDVYEKLMYCLVVFIFFLQYLRDGEKIVQMFNRLCMIRYETKYIMNLFVLAFLCNVAQLTYMLWGTNLRSE